MRQDLRTMKTDLSKAKKIYRMYMGSDKKINYEVYPVVYINKEYIYFKVPGNEMLDYLHISSVFTSFTSVIDNIMEGRKLPKDYAIKELLKYLSEGTSYYAIDKDGVDSTGAQFIRTLEAESKCLYLKKKIEMCSSNIHWKETAIKNSYETIEKARADISVLKEQKEEYENAYIEAKTALDKMKGEEKQ